jgi:DNA-binding GntR family transcriptional regulator
MEKPMNVKLGKLERTPALKQRAYQSLKHSILYDLSSGDPVVIEELAAQLGISRTPVREALLALEREGLVESVPNRGTFVVTPSIDEVIKIYQIRQALEPLATKLATPALPMETLEKLSVDFDLADKAMTAGNFDLYLQCDAEFHRLIMQYAENEILAQILGNLEDRIYRIRFHARRKSTENLVPAHREHRALLDALRARDADKAELLMKVHLQNAAKRIQAILSSENISR